MNSNDIINALQLWLTAQSFTPAIREITLAPLLAASAYPQLGLTLDSEEFGAGGAYSSINPGAAHSGGWPGASECLAGITLRLSCAAGRPADALSECRSLAHQLRSALLSSGPNLGGSAKQLAVGGIRYSALPVGDGAAGVIATAELTLSVRYVG